MIISRNLNQDVTMWEVTPDGLGGFIYGIPVVAKCRWENKIELFLNEKGEEKVSAAIVYLNMDTITGQYLYLGRTAEVDPTNVKSYRVRQINKIPSVDGLSYQMKAYL